ncbi:Sugar transporter, conserved site [Sesbania bispinosa]|nr:Sugar transporter, conserved site [Sesbania bispinosa]
MREVVIVAIATTLGNMLVGWDSSTIAGGMTYIKQEFNLETDPTLEGLIMSMSFLTGTVVTIFSGTVSDMLGRRPMLITSSVMFFTSGLVMLWAPNVTVILLARLLDGIALALTMTLTPLYISEIAPPDIRGTLNTLPQFSCSAGMFVAYSMVFSMSLMDSPSWRAMLGIVSIPAVAYFLIAVFYLPESPPWLVSKGRIHEAKKVLQRIRGVEDVSGELALLAEGMSPGGEATIVEEYIVAPASELIANKEAGKDCIRLYGANQEVSMIAQPVSGQGSMISRSMLGMSRQGSMVTQAASNLKDPIVNLFGSMHENCPPDIQVGSSRGSMLIPKVSSVSSMVDQDQSPFGTSDNLQAPLLSGQSSVVEKDKGFGSRDMLGMRSNSNLRSNTGLISGNAGEVPTNTNIGGGWQLMYKSAEATGVGKKEGGLQRVYLRADPNAVSQQGSFVSTSGYDLHADGGEAFSAAALVSRSVLCTKDMMTKPKVAAKGTGWRGLLDPGVKRALIVGIGLQILQQVALPCVPPSMERILSFRSVLMRLCHVREEYASTCMYIPSCVLLQGLDKCQASGINGFLYYAPQILEQAGVGALLSNLNISPTSASLLVNVMTTFAMLPCIAVSMRLMDIAGRRT